MKASSLESSAIYRCLLIRVTSEQFLFIYNIIDKKYIQVKVFCPYLPPPAVPRRTASY